MDNLAHLLAAHRASEFGLIGSLFTVGLAGSIAHCAAMCGPFVLAQVPADGRSKGGSALMRGALVPYHLGRATTYTLLEPYNEEIVRACIRCRGGRVDRRGDAGTRGAAD